MKMPDKIYLPENLSNSDKIRLSSVDEKGRGIPYVRKDAILEWAKKEGLPFYVKLVKYCEEL